MLAVHQYKVVRPFNNNVLLVERMSDGHEMVLIGKGLGFAEKKGNILISNDTRIEKTFLLEDEASRKQYQTMLNQVEDATIGVSEEIISLIAKHLSPVYNQHIHIALPDHIAFAIHRLKNGMEIVNPFLYEIETLYPQEYALSKLAAQLIETRLNVNIPASEVGFLALHIHSSVSQTPISQAVRHADLIRDILQMVRNGMNVQLAQGSRDCIRFVTHLKYALERLHSGKTIENPLLERIRHEFPHEFDFAEKIAGRIEQSLDIKVPAGEIGYITMHVHRLLNTQTK
ncbi:MAG TPA: transcription antiterminator [Bacilli bacterium]